MSVAAAEGRRRWRESAMYACVYVAHFSWHSQAAKMPTINLHKMKLKYNCKLCSNIAPRRKRVCCWYFIEFALGFHSGSYTHLNSICICKHC